ncbi:hypothetical protein OTU49_008609 [Cherax quadricarinatus]|uniref:Chemosensory protein n=1 Tax=Cherax quadricarinatus TaxID=27406 RepID=A0AAW0WT23_CHEQU|nr:uncharacterized protein LOC128697853 [Cherax quadricarinatus]
MKNAVCLVAALAVLVVAAEAQDTKTAFLATLTPEQIDFLSSQEGLDAMINCYPQKEGPQCSQLVLNTLKEFPQLVRDHCGLCDDTQKKTYNDVLDQVSTKFPDQFNVLRKLFLNL